MIKQNLILFRINLKIRFLCHRIIYRNSPLADSFFHIGACADAGIRQEFVQANHTFACCRNATRKSHTLAVEEMDKCSFGV